MSAKISVTFISRTTGLIIGEARIVEPPRVISAFDNLFNSFNNPFIDTEKKDFAPVPSSLSYNTDIFKFTDTFDFTIALAPDESFDIRSHDFVEFSIQTKKTGPKGIGISTIIHQIGVGILEGFQEQTNERQKFIQVNGRDLFGQFMSIPFDQPFQGQKRTMLAFIDLLLENSYIKRYLELRQPTLPKIRNLGAFATGMLFHYDLEQKRGQILQQYAELAINLVYMNRKGQVEILGRAETVGSTRQKLNSSPLGILQKGKNIESLTIVQNFTDVFSSYILFYSQGENIINANLIVRGKFENSDARVKDHIIQPEHRTFNTTDIQTLAGEIKFDKRIEDIAKSNIRKSNRNLNSIIIITSKPFFTKDDGTTQIPFEIGQLWTLKSNKNEFSTPQNNEQKVSEVNMVLTGIGYSQDESSLEVQLRFSEEDTII